MNRLVRLVAALNLSVLAFAGASAHGALRGAGRHGETPSLPFTVNLAPGDVLVHHGDRHENTAESYESLQMVDGDSVVGSGGAHRSVVLTNDSNAVEVLPGSQLQASAEGDPHLVLERGATRVGRASEGDGRARSLTVVSGHDNVVIHGQDVEIRRSFGNDPIVVSPEPDSRFLYPYEIPTSDFSPGRAFAHRSSYRIREQFEVHRPSHRLVHKARMYSGFIIVRPRHRSHRIHTHPRKAMSVQITAHKVSMLSHHREVRTPAALGSEPSRWIFISPSSSQTDQGPIQESLANGRVGSGPSVRS